MKNLPLSTGLLVVLAIYTSSCGGGEWPLWKLSEHISPETILSPYDDSEIRIGEVEGRQRSSLPYRLEWKTTPKMTIDIENKLVAVNYTYDYFWVKVFSGDENLYKPEEFAKIYPDGITDGDPIVKEYKRFTTNVTETWRIYYQDIDYWR